MSNEIYSVRLLLHYFHTRKFSYTELDRNNTRSRLQWKRYMQIFFSVHQFCTMQKGCRNHYSNTYAGRKSLSEIIHLLPFW